MTEPSSRREQGNGASRGGAPGDSWERRAAELASGVQRWLIKASARNVRDELGDQMRRAFRGQQRDAGDVWATATTEPPGAADEPPECAWCPVCRAARRIAESRAESGGGGSPLGDAADIVAGAVRDALAGIDSILSYRPGGASATQDGGMRSGETASGDAASSDAAASAAVDRAAPAASQPREPTDEPNHRG